MLGKWQPYLGSAWLPFLLSGMDEYTRSYKEEYSDHQHRCIQLDSDSLHQIQLHVK